MAPKTPKKGVLWSGRSVNPKAQTQAQIRPTNRRKNPRTPSALKPQRRIQPRWPTENSQVLHKPDHRFDYTPLPATVNPSILCLKIDSGRYRRAFENTQKQVDERKRWVWRSVRADWEASREWRDYIWRTRHEDLLRRGVNDWESLRGAAQEGRTEWELRLQNEDPLNQFDGSRLKDQSVAFEQTTTARLLSLQQQQPAIYLDTSKSPALGTETPIPPSSADLVQRPLHKSQSFGLCAGSRRLSITSFQFIGVKKDESVYVPTISAAPESDSLLSRATTTVGPYTSDLRRHLLDPSPANSATIMSTPNPITASTEESIKNLIHSLHSIQQHIHPSSFQPSHQADLNATLTRTAQNIISLRDHVSPTKNPSNPLHNLTLAPEAIDYVDAGRNPDIYTREFVELVQRGNSVLNGKQQAFRHFAEIFATDLKKAFGRGVEEEVDLVMENAGLVEREGGKWEKIDSKDDKKEERRDGVDDRTNGVEYS